MKSLMLLMEQVVCSTRMAMLKIGGQLRLQRILSPNQSVLSSSTTSIKYLINMQMELRRWTKILQTTVASNWHMTHTSEGQRKMAGPKKSCLVLISTLTNSFSWDLLSLGVECIARIMLTMSWTLKNIPQQNTEFLALCPTTRSFLKFLSVHQTAA